MQSTDIIPARGGLEPSAPVEVMGAVAAELGLSVLLLEYMAEVGHPTEVGGDEISAFTAAPVGVWAAVGS